MSEIQLIPLSSLTLAADLQSRADMNQETVNAYAEAMAAGDEFPPVELMQDGDSYYPVDGFHRIFAAKKNEAAAINAVVKVGSRRDAFIASLGANPNHGLPRSNADKRKAVGRALTDAELVKLSDHELAKICAVTQPFVSKMRKEMKADNGYQPVAEIAASLTPGMLFELAKRSTSGRISIWDKKIAREGIKHGLLVALDQSEYQRTERAKEALEMRLAADPVLQVEINSAADAGRADTIGYVKKMLTALHKAGTWVAWEQISYNHRFAARNAVHSGHVVASHDLGELRWDILDVFVHITPAAD